MTINKLPEEPAKALLAMVALNTSLSPSPTELLESMKAISGAAVDRKSLLAKDSSMTFELEKNPVGIGLMPTPIPWRDLEGPCATAGWWPEATERMKGHTSHVIIFLGGETGNRIQRHVILTRLTAAVAMHTDAAGIYWGNGTLVHDPQVFIEQAKNLSPDDVPLHLWIDFRVEPNDDGSYRLFTTGMKWFDELEIEIPHSQKEPAEVFDFACSIADYIITKNPNIQTGHTVGRSETERIRATHAPSMWDSAATVLRLDF